VLVGLGADSFVSMLCECPVLKVVVVWVFFASVI